LKPFFYKIWGVLSLTSCVDAGAEALLVEWNSDSRSSFRSGVPILESEFPSCPQGCLDGGNAPSEDHHVAGPSWGYFNSQFLKTCQFLATNSHKMEPMAPRLDQGYPHEGSFVGPNLPTEIIRSHKNVAPRAPRPDQGHPQGPFVGPNLPKEIIMLTSIRRSLVIRTSRPRRRRRPCRGVPRS